MIPRTQSRRSIRGEYTHFQAEKQAAAVRRRNLDGLVNLAGHPFTLRQARPAGEPATAGEEIIPQASVDENRIVLNRAGSIALSLISLRKELEATSSDGCLSPGSADNLLNVCKTLGFAEPMVKFVLGEANL